MGKILLYGGSGGIGSSIARGCVQQGQQVHLVGRNQQAMSDLASELGCTFTVGDVMDHETFSTATADAGEGLSGLVYSVGNIRLGSIQRLKADDFIEDFRLHCLGAALAVQAAVKPLKKHGAASIVLFSSVAASQGFTMHASVGMAKGGVTGLALSLAAELAPKIRVNAIAPSITRTQLATTLLKNEQVEEQVAGMHSMKRVGVPDDIAEMACFLLSEKASWITGQVFGIDGGRSTLRPAG